MMKHVVQRGWWFVFLVLGACFSPTFKDGEISCGPSELCPPDFDCVDGLCRSSSSGGDAGAKFTLTVSPGGNGTGTVESSPSGISCGGDCSEKYASGTMVTLTATPSSNSTFVGWSGACSGTGTCTVTVATDITVTANFALEYSLVVALAGNGSGFVTSNPSGISCGTDCTQAYTPNTMVVLTALAVSGSTFDSWSGGGCSGTGTCTVTLDAAKMVTASFSLTKHGLTVNTAGNGTGMIGSAPSGIDCGIDCSEAFDFNSMVTLTATPTTGSTFAGWSGGACTGTGTCVLTMTAAATVTATFTLTTHNLMVTRAGNGGGTVSSSPAGISCGGDCAELYEYNTMVTLSAAPSTGSVFAGWSGGGCSGTAACVLTMTAAAAVTATFTLTTPTLTVAKAGNGVGTVTSTPAGINCGIDCSEAVDYGTIIMLTATPAMGSTFTGWSGGGCSGVGVCMTTVTAATTVTATITLTTHTLTVTNTGTGQGTITAPGISCGVDCSEVYDYGTDVTLTAAPAAGSSFTGWSGGGCSGTGSCMLSITAAASVTATFTLTTHQLTLAKAGNGSGMVSSTPAGIDCGVDCTEIYGFGTNVTLTATPDAGSVFGGWSGGGCSGVGSCVVPISSATTVTATFTLTTQTLTVAISGGGVGSVTSNLGVINCPGDCSDPYNYGSVVTLTASAQAGSSFTGWSGGSCSGTGSCVVTMTGATLVTANFVLGSNSMTVTKAGNGDGTVTSNPAGINCGADCTENFTNGTMVTLTATPLMGSVFSGWSGGGCLGTGTCLVTVGAAVTITATFTLTVHTLIVTPGGNGAGTVTSAPGGISCGLDCSEPYNYGTSVTLTASASAGSSFAGWSGGGCSGTGTCIVSVTNATTVTPTFSLIQYALSVSETGNGSGTVTSNPAGINCGADCSEVYNSGQMVTLTAAPSTGSTFSGWSGSGCGGTGTCVVTMSAASAVTATFTLTTHQLTVTLAGPAGSGNVASSPAGVACPGDCTELYNYGTDVTLTATPALGFVFNGWSGGVCTGTGQCLVTATAATNVTATFAVATYTLTANLAGNGSGSVGSVPAGISCGIDCSELYNYNTSVTLTPTASIGSVFTGWAGACTGNGSCVVVMTAAASVTATFTLTTHQLTVTKNGTGGGGVTSSPTGISCGADCDELYNYNTMVVLTATPQLGSSFAGWTGACSGNGACTVTMTAARSVNARFDVIPPNYVFVTSTMQNGNLGGLAGADAICQARAQAGGLPAGTTYRAYLSTPTVNAPARLGSASGWVRRDGKAVADKVSDIVSGHLFYPIMLDELGTAVGEGIYGMTATTASGTYHSGFGSCNDYTSTQGPVFGGYPTTNSGLFSGFSSQSCATPSLRLYCFGIDNAAVVKPPPVTARRAFVSSPWTPTVNGGLAAADAVCTADAAAAVLPGTYKALLASVGATAISRFNTGAGRPPWARPDETLMATTAMALITPLTYLDASPNSNAANSVWFGQAFMWTGAPDLVTAGTAASTCNDWNDPNGTARIGLAGYSRVADWFGATSGVPCTTPNVRHVCLQE